MPIYQDPSKTMPIDRQSSHDEGVTGPCLIKASLHEFHERLDQSISSPFMEIWPSGYVQIETRECRGETRRARRHRANHIHEVLSGPSR
jgi:hypothetical protein